MLGQMLRAGAPEAEVRGALADALALQVREHPQVSQGQMRSWALEDVHPDQLERLRRYALITEGRDAPPPSSVVGELTEADLERLLPDRLGDEGRWRELTGRCLAANLEVVSVDELAALAFAVEQVPQLLTLTPPAGPRRLLVPSTRKCARRFIAAARERIRELGSSGAAPRLAVWVERRPGRSQQGNQELMLCATLEGGVEQGEILSVGVACQIGMASVVEDPERLRQYVGLRMQELGFGMEAEDLAIARGDWERLRPFEGERPPARVRGLGALLGAGPCRHPQLTETPNATGDTVAIGCKLCGRERLAVVGVHRLPDGHPLLRQALVRPEDYLAAERRYAALAGDPRPLPADIRSLRARDGAIEDLRDLLRVARPRGSRSLADALGRPRR